jgi:hypothetical protein
MKQRFINLKGLLALALGVVTIASTGCDPKEPAVPTLPTLVVKDTDAAEVVNNQTFSVAKDGGEIDLIVSTNRGWKITTDSWVTAAPTKGDAGEKSVTLTVAANDGESRTATVTVATTSDNLTKTFKIAQAGEVPKGSITVAEVRAMGETAAIAEDETLVVTVISDASSSGGNSTSLQNIVVQDETAGIAIRLAAKPTDNEFAFGDVLSIKVKDIQIQKYQDLLQLNNVPLAAISEAGTNVITHKSITAAELISGDYESQLVAVADVQFVSDVTGKPIGTDADHATLNMEAKGGETFAAFVSKYSKFITNTVPAGSGTMKGIASINKGVIQLLPQTAADFNDLTGARFDVPKFGVSSTAVSVSAAGGNATVDVTGNVAWKVEVKDGGADYLTGNPSPMNGNDAGTITLNFKPNESTETDNKVTITVSTEEEAATKSFDVEFTQSKVYTETITVAAIRAMGETTIATDGILVATVISDASPTGGNSTSLRNIVVQDATAGIAIRLAADPTTNQFAFGDILAISVNGLQIQKYNGLLQLNNVPLNKISEQGNTPMEYTSITATQLVSGAYESQLVAVSGVQFVSDVVGKPFGTSSNNATLAMESSDGKSFEAFVSRYSSFITNTVPSGSGVIKGIASIDLANAATDAEYQILPQTADDFSGLTGDRFPDLPKFGVSKTAISVPATGGEVKFNVTGNVEWTIAVEGDGATYLSAGPTPASGTGEIEVSVTFTENTSTEAKPIVKLTVSTENTGIEEEKRSIEVIFTQNKVSTGGYAKVTTAPADWSGEYLIVYEADSYAFDGGLSALDVTKNGKTVTIVDKHIASETETDAAKFTIAAVEGGYSIQSASGYYIGKTASGNGMNTSTSQAYVNTISLDGDGNAVITGSGGTALRFNNANSNGNYRFRYYGSQQPIALYKLQ